MNLVTRFGVVCMVQRPGTPGPGLTESRSPTKVFVVAIRTSCVLVQEPFAVSCLSCSNVSRERRSNHAARSRKRVKQASVKAPSHIETQGSCPGNSAPQAHDRSTGTLRRRSPKDRREKHDWSRKLG